MSTSSTRRWFGKAGALAAGAAGLMVAITLPASSATAAPHVTYGHVAGSHTAVTQLDCNGQSPIQKANRANLCTDIRGISGIDNKNNWGGRFYDNGEYIGHDEPDATFLSNAKGSGNDVNWGLTLGSDPAAAPTDATPGSDVSHWFELSSAPWLSMALCDGNSYPQLPCKPESDTNAPKCFGLNCTAGQYPGAGGAFMEMQFYPPGNAPFLDNESCDNTHWCAAITVDELLCTLNYASCNNNCEEPLQFAFIQTDGIPDPQGAIPDAQTLLMNPGDRIKVHMYDAPAAGGGKAFEVVIDDLTTGVSGSMQASAANGFGQFSIANCSFSPYNFEPEYATAAKANIIPWAALSTNISTEFETGHYEPCTSLTSTFPGGVNPFDSSDPDGTLAGCSGPYEAHDTSASEGAAEYSDAICYQAGDTHTGYAGPGTSSAPNELTGCQDNVYQNGDLDFDGSAYWSEWPTSATAGIYPSSFLESAPTSHGGAYRGYFFQTDVALSESGCSPTAANLCTATPAGPGGFYPFWSLSKAKNGACTFEFGNVTQGARLNDFGQDAQYGKVQWKQLGYPEIIGPTHDDDCST
jgi:hypothetical protein